MSSRENTCFKRYSLTGEYLSSIELHGAYVCRPVVHEENIYAGVGMAAEVAHGSCTDVPPARK